MQIGNLLKEKKGKPVISFEFSRAKTEKAAESLDRALDSLAKTGPDYVSVTFGAGGSTREGSFQLVDKLKNEKGFNVVAYIAGVGLGPDDITSVLDKFKSLGIETIFAIRGDEPQGEAEFTLHHESKKYASELISAIKEKYDFCIGAAGYPEGHIEAESKEKDLECLKQKVDNGAEYIVAQYFYDNQYFYDFVEHCRAIGIEVPIIPGIMPIYSVKMMEILAKVCGTEITADIRDGLANIPPDDKDGIVQFGIDFATEQCRDLLKNGVQGLHFYTMNRAKTVEAVLKTLRDEGLLNGG